MSTTTTIETLDERKYGRLLARALPVAPKTEAENDRMLGEIERLMLKGENLSVEEGALLEVMATLVERFEREHYEIPEGTPGEVLRLLMEDRDLRQRDLLPVFGSRSRVSEALSGKREISKAQAKALAEFFGVSAELFL